MRKRRTNEPDIDPLVGKAVIYSPAEAPFTEGIPEVHQQLHFVVPVDLLTGTFSTFSCYNSQAEEAKLTMPMLAFVAQAVSNVVKYRGTKAPNYYEGETPRFQVLLSYIPKQIYREGRNALLGWEEMVQPSNVAALMVSVLILDKELNFPDAFSDMIEWNHYGEPLNSKTWGDDVRQQAGAAAARPAAPPKGRGRPRRRRPRASSDDEDNGEDLATDSNADDAEYEPEMQDFAPAAAAKGPPRQPDRKDVPGMRLSHGKYHFAKTEAWRGAIDNSHSDICSYAGIRDLMIYSGHMCVVTGGTAGLGDQRFKSDVVRLSDPDLATHPFNPIEAFSLRRALGHLNGLPCDIDPQLLNPENWFDAESRSFGAPYIRLGEDVGAYREKLQICALLAPQNFTAERLFLYRLPHAAVVRKNAILPEAARAPTPFMAGGELYDLTDIMEMCGVRLAADRQRLQDEKNMTRDPLNKHFADYFARMSEIQNMQHSRPREFFKQSNQMRRQGKAWLEQVVKSGSEGSLPKGMQRASNYMSQFSSPIEVDNMLWAGPVAMEPFCQYLIKDHRSYAKLMNVADSGLAVTREVWLSACSAGMPRIGVDLNKLHCKVVGPPATSKTNTLELATSLLIPGSINELSGTSAMGGIRVEESERLVEMYPEMPPAYNPTEDIKTPEAQRLNNMALTKISEGRIGYRSSGKQLDATGVEVIRQVTTWCEWTNVIIGACNPSRTNLSPDGSAAAMDTRFRTILMFMPTDSQRTKVVESMSKETFCPVSAVGEMIKTSHRYRHGMMMLYALAISCYAVPLPGMGLFSDQFPLAIDNLAEIRPEVSMALRSLSRIKSKCVIETINYAVRMACLSPLAPRFQAQVRAEIDLEELDEEHLPPPPDFFGAMEEIARYCYLNQAIFWWVVTDYAHEMLDAHGFALLKAIAARSANYFAFGMIPDRDSAPLSWAEPPPERAEEEGQVLNSADSNRSRDARIASAVTSTMTMDDFVAKVKLSDAHSLMLPMSNATLNAQKQAFSSRPGNNNSGCDNHRNDADDLTPKEYAGMYYYNMDGNKGNVRTRKLDRKPPPLVTRFVLPRYKSEFVPACGLEMINPNYVEVPGTISQICSTIGSKVGSVMMEQSQTSALLCSMSRRYMEVPMMPLQAKYSSPLVHTSYAELQSLRYSRWAMGEFPVYKVPVLVQDLARRKCYILVEAIEQDIHRICHDMVDDLSYSGTTKRSLLFGFPSRESYWHYETHELEPQPDVDLAINKHSKLTQDDLQVLDDYSRFLPEQDEERIYGFGDCIEELNALTYLRQLASPEMPLNRLRDYLPDGINRRLYGPGGYYERHPKNLKTQKYSSLEEADAAPENLGHRRPAAHIRAAPRPAPVVAAPQSSQPPRTHSPTSMRVTTAPVRRGSSQIGPPPPLPPPRPGAYAAFAALNNRSGGPSSAAAQQSAKRQRTSAQPSADSNVGDDIHLLERRDGEHPILASLSPSEQDSSLRASRLTYSKINRVQDSVYYSRFLHSFNPVRASLIVNPEPFY